MVAAISSDQLMSQMQAMIAQARQSNSISSLNSTQAQTNGTQSIGQAFNQVMQQVNSQQVEANQLRESFAVGDPNVSLAQVMVASQKARVGFEATVYVRKQMISAYKEIMQMPV